MANTSNMIEFSIGMKTSVRKTVNEGEYEGICKVANCFEYITDDRPVKLYFDADHFFSENFENYSEEAANNILNTHIMYIENQLFYLCMGHTPIFAIAESHSKSRMKNGKEVWGYSFHIVVTNVLVFKKDQRILVEKLNKDIIIDQKRNAEAFRYSRRGELDKCKFLYTTYEPLLEGMQDTFDTSVYNSGQQKIRCVYSSKEGEDRPFNLLKECSLIDNDNIFSTFNNMVITGFIDKDAIILESKTEDVVEEVKTYKVKDAVVIDDEIIDKYIDYAEICDVSVFQRDYMQFYKFCRASSNLGIPYNIFDDIVHKLDAGNYDYDKNLLMYEEPHNEAKGKLGWRFIYSFAKESDPQRKMELDAKYDAISRKKIKDMKKKTKESENEEKEDLIGIRDGDDENAAKVILENHPNWIYCNQVLHVHNQFTGMWSSNKSVQDFIISKYSDKLDILSQDGKKKTGKNYSKCSKKCNDIYPKLKQFTLDDNWVERTENSSRGYLLYKNGYYDLKNGIFYDSKLHKYDPEIVFIYRIDHDYVDPNEEDMQYIESIRQRIFFLSLGEEQGKYLLQLISRGLSGEQMKRIFFGLGPSNSGKSIISKAISLSCGQYVGTFNAENLSFNSGSSDEAQRLRWAYLLKDKRIIISNEMTTKGKIDGNLLKKISSGGDTLIGRVHGGCETQYVPQFLPIIFANDLPTIEPYDDAVDKRTIVATFNNCFVTNPNHKYEVKKDDTLESEMSTIKFQQAFVNLLINTYRMYVSNGSVDRIPREIHEAKFEWLDINANEDDQRFSSIIQFSQQFEFTNDVKHFTHSYQMISWIEKNARGISSKKFIIEMKKYCLIKNFTNVHSKKKSIDGLKCNGWIGIRNVNDVEIEETDTLDEETDTLDEETETLDDENDDTNM